MSASTPGPAPPPRAVLTGAPSLQRIAWVPILAVAGIALAALLAVSGRYGYHRDELYFIQAGGHLALGYPDQPLLTPVLTWTMNALAPRSLLALRTPAALAGVASIVSAGLIAREAGGGRRAQAIAASSCVVALVVLATSHFLTTETLDLAFSSVVCWLLVRLLRTEDERLWVVAGAVLGFGLLNKLLVGVLAAAVIGSLLVVGPRAHLRSRWAAAGAALALLGALPYVAWQLAHGVPQAAVAHSQAQGGEEGGRGGFIPFQLALVGPLLVPVWLAGLVGRPAGSGVWQTPVDLSAAGQTAFSPQVAVDPQGNAVAVWRRFDGANFIVQGAVRPAGSGVWQTPVDLSAAGQTAFSPQVAVDPQGNAIAVWYRFNGANFIVQGAVRPAGSGVWQTPVDLSAAGQTAESPQVAVDPQGNAIAVWERFNGANYIIQGAGYDAAGPLLRGVSIPTAGTAGQLLAFSVSPLDVWSALGATSWSFGDGASANGTSVTHAYAAAGSYRVTLTSAEVLGNTTSAAGTAVIAPAPTTTTTKTTTTQPPTLTAASLTNKRFRVANKDTAISAKKAPLGTTFRFTLSAAAKLQITITSTAPGLRRGRSCLAPTAKLRRAHAKHCTRTLTVGTLTRSSEPEGADSIPFSGRIGHRALSPHAYNAILTASDAGGRSKPVTLAFVVVR